jgi:hypothetical protein
VTKRIASLLLVISACAAETSDRVPATTTDAPPPDDGAPTAELPRAREEEAPLLAWSFEPASGDCNGWPVVGADAIRASPSRSGAYSCKVCSNGSAAGVGLMRDLGTVPSGRYVLTAWVRKRVQNAAPSEALAQLDATLGTTNAVVTASAPSVSIRDAWDRIETTLDLAEPASNLRVSIRAPSAEADRCLFVDDVTLTREH